MMSNKAIKGYKKLHLSKSSSKQDSGSVSQTTIRPLLESKIPVSKIYMVKDGN